MTWRPTLDGGWRAEVIRSIESIRGGWASRFSPGLRDVAIFVTARTESLAIRGYDCAISLARVPLAEITVRDPRREGRATRGYPQLLTDLGDPAYDSLPVVCARSGGRIALWDGHHRLRTYELAERVSIPALVVALSPGNGLISLDLGEASSSSGTGTPGP